MNKGYIEVHNAPMSNPAVRKDRQVNLELLRIVSMLMIITLHFLDKGGILSAAKPSTITYYAVWIMEGISCISVNCFVMISGYFMVESRFKIKKLLILIVQVLFYTVGFYCISVGMGINEFSFKELVLRSIPILTRKYWYVTVYVGLYILSPFLNLAIKAMTRSQHLWCVIVLISLFSVWPNVIYFANTLNSGGPYGIVWFVCLYFFASYLRLYYKPSYNSRKYLIEFLFSSGLIPLSMFLIAYITNIYESKIIKPDLFYTYDSILVFAASALFFLLFLNIRIHSRMFGKLILFFSPLTLGVYLVHDNQSIRYQMWNLIHPEKYVSQPIFLLYMLISILAVFLISSFIEFGRKMLFSPVDNSKWLESAANRLEALFGRINLFLMRESRSNTNLK